MMIRVPSHNQPINLMTQHTIYSISQITEEPSLSALFLINSVLVILVVAMGFVALHLLFRHVDDREV